MTDHHRSSPYEPEINPPTPPKADKKPKAKKPAAKPAAKKPAAKKPAAKKKAAAKKK